MKANLIATLILGDVMERGYFANVSEENAEYAGSMVLQNARKKYHILRSIETKSQQQNHRQNEEHSASKVLKYRYSCPCTKGRIPKYNKFLKCRLIHIKGGGGGGEKLG